MVIIGIGNDLIAISRIQHTYSRFGNRFLNRFLNPHEMYLVSFILLPILALFFLFFFSIPTPLQKSNTYGLVCNNSKWWNSFIFFFPSTFTFRLLCLIIERWRNAFRNQYHTPEKGVEDNKIDKGVSIKLSQQAISNRAYEHLASLYVLLFLLNSPCSCLKFFHFHL